MKSKAFENKVVVVTGASSGIGRATARAFGRAGARTVLVSRSSSTLEAVADEIRQDGGTALAVPADVTSAAAVAQAVEATVRTYETIDVLFNNAGKSFVGGTDDADFVDKARDMFETDYLGTVRMTQAVVPIMKKQGSGHILNMSSVVGRKSFPGFGAYSAVMHAIDGYTSALRQELRGSGIHVSIIHPALTQTPLLATVEPEDMPSPFRRLSPIAVEQVAEAALKGLQNRTARIVVPWQPRLLMLAEALSPKLGDWFVEALQNPLFGRLAGTYRGRIYQHESS